jgi:hypothetical protein
MWYASCTAKKPRPRATHLTLGRSAAIGHAPLLRIALIAFFTWRALVCHHITLPMCKGTTDVGAKTTDCSSAGAILICNRLASARLGHTFPFPFPVTIGGRTFGAVRLSGLYAKGILLTLERICGVVSIAGAVVKVIHRIAACSYFTSRHATDDHRTVRSKGAPNLLLALRLTVLICRDTRSGRQNAKHDYQKSTDPFVPHCFHPFPKF